MARPTKNVLDVLQQDTSVSHQEATEEISSKVALDIERYKERLQGMRNHATAQLEVALKSRDYSTRWKLEGFIEALDMVRREQRALVGDWLGESPEVAEVLLRKIAQGK
jgi:hypothetical protein